MKKTGSKKSRDIVPLMEEAEGSLQGGKQQPPGTFPGKHQPSGAC
jgi:hypothetical protein